MSLSKGTMLRILETWKHTKASARRILVRALPCQAACTTTLLASLRAMVLPKTCGLPWRWNFEAQRSLDCARWHWDSIPSRCSMVIPRRSIWGKFLQWFVSWRLLGIIWLKSSRSRLRSVLSLTHENKWSSTWHTMRVLASRFQSLLIG